MDRLAINGGLTHGPSRMKGNLHVRFLGEGVAAMSLPYPTTLSQTRGKKNPELRCRWNTFLPE
jgi:hypothetical protein